MYIFEILKVFNEPDFFLKKNILFVFFFKIFVKKMLLPCGSSFWHKESMLDYRVSGSDSFQVRAVPVIVIPAVPNYVTICIWIDSIKYIFKGSNKFYNSTT